MTQHTSTTKVNAIENFDTAAYFNKIGLPMGWCYSEDQRTKAPNFNVSDIAAYLGVIVEEVSAALEKANRLQLGWDCEDSTDIVGLLILCDRLAPEDERRSQIALGSAGINSNSIRRLIAHGAKAQGRPVDPDAIDSVACAMVANIWDPEGIDMAPTKCLDGLTYDYACRLREAMELEYPEVMALLRSYPDEEVRRFNLLLVMKAGFMGVSHIAEEAL